MGKNEETILITAFTQTVEKLDKLRELVKKIKSFGYKVCLITHTSTPQDIIDRCDYFIYDRENEVNYDIDIRHWRYCETPNFFISYKPHNLMATHIVPIVRLIIGGMSYLKSLGAKKVYMLEYDTIMESDDVFVKLSSELDNSTISSFFDGWGKGIDNAKKYDKGKYLFGPLTGMNVDQIDFSTVPTDSETLINLFRKYFHEEKTPVTERILYDLLWSNYTITWNKFFEIKTGLTINTSADEQLSYSDRTYCFFLHDNKVKFFVENKSGGKLKIDLIVNDSCTQIEIENDNNWALRTLSDIDSIKTIKVIVNNKFVEEIDMSLNESIERITRWVFYKEKMSSVENKEKGFLIDFDMVPRVEIKNSDNISKNVKFVGVDENGIENLCYETNLSEGNWAKPNQFYHNNWRVYIDNVMEFQTHISFSPVCVVVASYPNSVDVRNKTVETIRNIKQNLSLPTICTTHIDYEPDPESIKSEVDHYIMNPINTLTKHSYYRYYRGNHENHTVYLDLWESGNSQYHGPAVHQCYYNAVKFAKEYGYQYAILTNFDMVFSEKDIQKIKCILNTVITNKTDGFFFYSLNEEGPTYATVFCVVNVHMFLEKFSKEILNENDYEELVKSVGSESNGLENIYFHVLKNENLTVHEERESDYFESDKCMTNSQADYLAILPIKKEDEQNSPARKWGIFIRKSNKDISQKTLNVLVELLETNEVVYKESFVIVSDICKVIPINFENTNQYRVTLTEEEDSRIISKTIREIVDFQEIEKNGVMIEN